MTRTTTAAVIAASAAGAALYAVGSAAQQRDGDALAARATLCLVRHYGATALPLSEQAAGAEVLRGSIRSALARGASVETVRAAGAAYLARLGIACDL